MFRLECLISVNKAPPFVPMRKGSMSSTLHSKSVPPETEAASSALGLFNTFVAPNVVGAICHDEDGSLIAKCQAGDISSFGQLVERHEQRVRSIVTRILASSADSKSCQFQCADIDDLSQEVFVQAWRALPRFRGDARFSTWLYRIAVNRALKEYNYRKRGPGRLQGVPVSDELLRHLASTHPTPDAPLMDPENVVQQRVRDEALRSAIDSLPEKQRLVVLLHYFEECSCEEIAIIVGCNIGTVWSRLHYACRRLQDRLSWMDPSASV
jgi:RNA polymerase sigma-70 factor, ECF subfamily